jgi:cardiolipin synthase
MAAADWMGLVADSWELLLLGAHLAAAGVASGHAILHKREVRAAVGWTGLIWLAPLYGSLLYYFFGINRIQRRARELKPGEVRYAPEIPAVPEAVVDETLPASVRDLDRYERRLTATRLVSGNRITPLRNGDAAYPAMIEAIRTARTSVGLSTYIFDNDRAGTQFLKALRAAMDRGVAVRVLVDAMGARYSKPSMVRRLAGEGIPVAEFLPSILPWRNPYLNLRNHRKILVVDGRVGFTGGLNIREGCLLALHPAHPTQDTHFRLEGPVVAQLTRCFAEDWHFATRERLEGEAWFPRLEPVGGTACRGIMDGPDDHFEQIWMTLLGALENARHRVQIVTPYFLPDQTLITALNTAALRGVEVDILVPERGNLRFVEWAMAAQAPFVMEHGCRIWLTAPPFDHSKLMVVDGAWVLFGSANWDPRSLQLNFEFNVSCYDRDLGARATAFVDALRAGARPLGSRELQELPLWIRLRNGAARLFQPYL